MPQFYSISLDIFKHRKITRNSGIPDWISQDSYSQEYKFPEIFPIREFPEFNPSFVWTQSAKHDLVLDLCCVSRKMPYACFWLWSQILRFSKSKVQEHFLISHLSRVYIFLEGASILSQHIITVAFLLFNVMVWDIRNF